MKCFNHSQTEAVGICKNCNKGICKECLTELKNGIACTSTCTEEVTILNELIDRNKQSHAKVSNSYKRNAFIYGSLGLVTIGVGIYQPGAKLYLIPTGIIFCIGAVLSFNTSKKYEK